MKRFTPVCTEFAGVIAIALLVMLSPALSSAAPIVADEGRGELRLQGEIQKNPVRPIHGDWGKKSTAFIGVRGGSEARDFVVLLDADRAAIYDAALHKLRWQTGRRFSWMKTYLHKGFSKRTGVEDYMTGDPLLCALEFDRDGKTIRIPIEDAIRARIEIEDTWVEVPYTPHFVFTGAGEENGINSGCLVCPSDCVGGLITDNAVPVQTEAQEFLVNWSMLPPPGAKVTVILRSIR